MAGEGIIESPILLGVPVGGTTGQVLVGVTGAAPAWSSSPSVLGTVTAKPSGTAGIRLDPNAATGDFTLSLSPKNLTASRRVSFPDRDLDLSPLYSDGTNLGIGVAPTAGNGLLQLASGTTKANGISMGTDLFVYRESGTRLAIADGASKKVQINPTYIEIGVADGSTSDQTTLIDFHASEGTTGQTDYSSRIIRSAGANGAFMIDNKGTGEVQITSNGAVHLRLGSGGEWHFSGGTPVAKPTLPAAATDAATTQALANAIRTALINNGLAA
jgi:hypothetical protein